jgi:hypothetical protein
LTLLARLTLLVLAETAVLELFEQFVEAVAQGLLALPAFPASAKMQPRINSPIAFHKAAPLSSAKGINSFAIAAAVV